MIRKATMNDWNCIMEIYDRARAYMHAHGNPNQWKAGYPANSTIEQNIKDGDFYVSEDEDGIQCVFFFSIGDDPTYQYIEGAWKNDAPYGVIHRVASAGNKKGAFDECLDFCSQQISNLRMDTHQDNTIMQHVLEKHGFERCGIIYVAPQNPRIAYQKTIS